MAKFWPYISVMAINGQEILSKYFMLLISNCAKLTKRVI